MKQRMSWPSNTVECPDCGEPMYVTFGAVMPDEPIENMWVCSRELCECGHDFYDAKYPDLKIIGEWC